MNAGIIFDKQEKQMLVNAIAEAEKNTSGEIRLHIENLCKNSPYERALVVFHQLKMEKTAERNAVLIYLAIKDRKLAIVGDKGIHDIVTSDYWDSILDELKNGFIKEQYLQPLILAIQKTGEKLGKYFPLKNNDKDELDNEISFG